MINVQRNLIDLRENKKLTQEQFSKKLAISRKRYAAWEEGRRRVPLDIAVKVARYYKITVDQLVIGNCEIATKCSTH